MSENPIEIRVQEIKYPKKSNRHQILNEEYQDDGENRDKMNVTINLLFNYYFIRIYEKKKLLSTNITLRMSQICVETF